MSQRFGGLNLGLSLFLCFGFSANAIQSKTSVESHISNNNKKMQEIFSQDKDPTGHSSWFLGQQNWLNYSSKKPINRADLKFASWVMQIYSMYCDLKGKKERCLSNRLKIYTAISGKSVSGASLYVKVNGQTKASNSFQEMRAFIFQELEKYGNAVSITSEERDLIQPAPRVTALVRFLVHTRKTGSGNNQWSSPDFRPAVLENAGEVLGQVLSFKEHQSEIIKKDKLYDKKQRELLKSYSGKKDDSVITAAISGPNANDSGGIAYVNRPGKPFVMKSCTDMRKNKKFTFDTDANCTARGIFLHELAHVYGLNHCKSRDQSKLCTENYWRRDDGRKWLLKQLSSRSKAIAGVGYAY